MQRTKRKIKNTVAEIRHVIEGRRNLSEGETKDKTYMLASFLCHLDTSYSHSEKQKPQLRKCPHRWASLWFVLSIDN